MHIRSAKASVSDCDGRGDEQVVPRDPPTGRGRRHGTSSTEPYDRWFRYPAGFASDYASILLGQLTLEADALVVDPFCGSGVAGTAARKSGYSFYGIEAHPLIAELAQIKLEPSPGAADGLMATCDELILEAAASPGSPSRLDAEPDLVRRCFEPDTLLRLLALRENIRMGMASVWAPYAKWALLGTLRDVASSKTGWPYQRPGSSRTPRFKCALTRFRQRMGMMASDLAASTPSSGTHQVVLGDSTERIAWSGLSGRRANACVSSPPYLNNFDYADATRLELYFWGDVTSWSQMCIEVRNGMLTATTQQSRLGRAKRATSTLRQFGELGEEVIGIATRLRNERLSRARGKEYDRVVPDYFVSVNLCLENLHQVLKPGSSVVLLIGDSAPYGVYIDTPRIVASLATTVGFATVGDMHLRKRGLRWANNGTRHSVELSERLVTLKAI